MRVPLFRPHFTEADVEALAEVLYSGHLTTGPKCEELERRFSAYLGVAHAVSTNSGSAALHLALATAGIGPGDAVFVPTLAFASDAQTVEWAGAVPVFVDCEPRTLCMDPVKLREAVEHVAQGAGAGPATSGPGTPRAVIVVDYAGQMADYAALRAVCEEWGLILIEDASHALPAAFREHSGADWKSVGTVADATCFSFYATKPLTTGEGGMLVSENAAWIEESRRMRLHGFSPRALDGGSASWDRQVVTLGFKYNLSDLAAALGIGQLLRLDEHHQARRRIARGYAERLERCRLVQLPEELPDRRHAWHLYVVRLRTQELRSRRAAVMRQLNARGVETSVHWCPLHLHAYYAQRRPPIAAMPTAEALHTSLLSLPIFPGMTDQELDFVADTIERTLEEISWATWPRDTRP